MALELSNKQWKVVFSAGSKRRRVTGKAGDLAEVAQAVTTRQERVGGMERRVVRGSEAGGEGFWWHRGWVAQGIENRVMDAASMEMPRRRRRVKTDRMDGDQ